ncbi:HAMP domain-containing protein [bacterium 3DAC]|nr:HAMP domain-containing protein [bacterium 3DAC]
MTRVRTKILMPLIIMLVMSIIGFAFNAYMIDKIFDDGAVINVAGRQRMLTQRMAKNAMMVYASVNKDNALKELALARDLFDVSLKALIEGGQTYADLDMTQKTAPLPPASGAPLQQLKKVQSLWEPFKAAVNKVEESQGADKEAIQYIADHNNELLAEMNKAVGLFQDAYEAKLHTINDISLGILLINIIIIGLFFFYFEVQITRPLRQLEAAMEDLAEGEADLTRRLPAVSKDEIGRISLYFNKFMDRLQNLIKSFVEAVEQGYAYMEEFHAEITSLEEASKFIEEVTDEITASISDMSINMEQISDNVKQVADSAIVVAESATELSSHMNGVVMEVEEGNQVVEDAQGKVTIVTEKAQTMMEKTDALEKSVNAIGDIIDVISSIAEQTNLLALNAAIEAARAGEAGRGFAVVADEIRKLAEETQRSTEEIGAKLKEIISATKETAGFSREVGEAIQSVGESMNRIVDIFGSILEHVQGVTQRTEDLAAVAEEQSATAEEISAGVEVVSQNIESIAKHMEEINEKINSFASDVRGLAQKENLIKEIFDDLANKASQFNV